MDTLDTSHDRDRPARSAVPDGGRAPAEDRYAGCEPVAVIGLACRFPGAPDSAAYWRNLVDGVESSRRFSRDELRAGGVDDATAADPNYVAVAAVLDDVEAFDAPLFGYSRQEAEVLDPQQRLFLQIVWHSLEHAGYAPRRVPHKTGVFGAARMSTYPGRERIARGVSSAAGLQALLGNDKDYLATRVAYKLNLRGPALTIQTACSSSLVTVHMACESLRAGECDMAVAGGTAVSFPLEVGYLWQPGMIFSQDGRCRPFDANAAGTYGGHGVGAVTLRRLEDALRDGDPILAVIRGSAINNDGSLKVGFTAPSVAGQREAIREAMVMADVTADDIGMIEAHGTATSLGDPIEIEALAAAMAGRRAAAPVWIGSVKGNFGHLDTAAGIASLIKAVLSVHHGAIPPSLGFETPNPALKLEATPFRVATRRQAWMQKVRTAGVSSFGLGGTNCHVVVQSAPPRAEVPWQKSVGGLLVSAATQDGLRRLAADYAARMRGGADAEALAGTALAGREHGFGHRLAVRLGAQTPAALGAFAGGTSDPLVFTGEDRGRPLWLFSGQGTQWAGMGQWHYGKSKVFAKTLDACCDLVSPHLDLPLREVMFGAHPDALADMTYAQPAIVTFQLAMAAYWRNLGLEPAAVLGHSVGEFAAAVVAGLLPAETMLPLVVERGRLMQAHGAEGAMLAAFADEATLRPLIDSFGLDIAADNDERHLVVSGRAADIGGLAQALDARDIHHSRLAVSGAAHSALLDPMLERFAEAAKQVESGAPVGAGDVVYVSGLLGRIADPAELRTRDYWRRHVREPVRYRQALAQALDEPTTFGLELGAEAPLTGIGRRAFPQRTWIASAKGQEPPEATLETAYLQLYATGLDLSWTDLWLGTGRKCHAPLYPFATDRYTCAPSAESSDAQPAAGRRLDGAIDAGRRVATAAASTLDLARLQALYDCVMPLHAIYVDAMVRCCVGDRIEAGVAAIDILRGGRLLPRYWQLLVRLLTSCTEDGYYRAEGELFVSARPVPHEARGALIDELRSYCEGLDAIPETVARAGAALPAMMRGDVDPVSIIFPSSAHQGVEVLYQDFSFGRYFNEIAAGVLAEVMRERRAGRRERPFDILEVGGGTGGTTAWMLPELRGQPNVAYDFTDISPIFTRRAAEKFADYDFVAYRELDLERDVEAQGFAAASYDLIVAANVIHATQHVGRTLRRLRGLLKPGGRLVMREITRPMRLFDFVFGPLVAPLLDLPERGGELFLDTGRWEKACRAAGFETVEWLPDDGCKTSRISEHVIVAGIAASAQGAHAAWTIGEDTGDAILGRAVGRGAYIADWSDCLDDADWQRRLADAARALANRHDTKVPSWSPASRPSLGLSEVRLALYPGLFGDVRVDIEAPDADGEWQIVARSMPALAGSPQALPSPPASASSTHYRWGWRAAKTVDEIITWRVPGATDEQVAAWCKAGVRIEPAARAHLVVPPGGDAMSLAAGLLSSLQGPPPDRLVVVTRQAWPCGDRDLVDPAQRAAWGFLRVAAVESPAAFIGAIDLSADAEPGDLARGLAAIEAGERWVSVRDGEVLAQELIGNTTMQPAMPPDALADPRWHVVTGGFGGLGRISVAWLIRQGARNVAILAPRASNEAAKWQADLQTDTGATIRWLDCDVAKPDALRTALDKLTAEGGIAGVLHAAGVLDDAPLVELDAARLDHVFALKAGAADILVDHLAADRRGYLVLYSSAAAALGAPGQGAHALACAYLDGLADRGRASGLAVASIAWGAWGEIGRAAAPEIRQKLAAEGMGWLKTSEGLWHLEQTVLGASACRLAMRLDAARIDERRQLFPKTPQRTIPAAAESRQSATAKPGAEALRLSGDEARDTASLEQWLGRRVASQLRLDPAMLPDADRDLLQLGLDSLLFLELSAEVERTFGVRLDAKRAYQAMTIAGLAGLILSDRKASHDAGSNGSASALAVSDPASRFEPFPLTPIQHAYWLGRTDLLAFGGIACHVVFEWDKHVSDCDPDVLETAWNTVIGRHDMLRATIAADGLQRVADAVRIYRFTRNDLRGLPATEADARLTEVRERLSREVSPADRWPLFEVVVSWRDDGDYRLHIKLDLLLFDVQSFKVLFDDLSAAFAGAPLTPLDFTFRDYVVHKLRERERPAARAAWRYWHDAIETLPPAPDLSLAEGTTVARPTVVTRQGRLDEADWSRLKTRWQSWGVTPSAGLLTLFALVLERASRRPDFTLNLTFFNRQPIHPDVAKLIGDFTSVLLVEFDANADKDLRRLMEATQARLWAHLANSGVNGVDVMREMGRRRGIAGRPLMPVVFTSMLGMTLDGMSIDRAMTRLLGTPVHVFTQTPQVWIDHQAMEEDGGLLFHWYCMDKVLAPGLAAALFADYDRLLNRLAAQPDADDLAVILPARRPHPDAAGPKLDWRDLEAVLRTYPGVDAALIDSNREDAAPVAWLRIDPRHPAEGVSADVDTRALPALGNEALAEVERVWHHLEARALRGLWTTLQNYSLFLSIDARVTHPDACQRIGIAAANRRLLRQWLDHLAVTGLLKRDGDGFVRTDIVPPPQDATPSGLPDWAHKLVRFVDGNIESHDALLRGERSALEIFFDTHADAARVLYGTHPVITCLHEAAAAAVRQLAEGRENLRVLEVGAGFGVTADVLLPALDGKLETYTFTDVSTLFLDDARTRFADRPAMRYALFDINAAPDFAVHPVEGYDLIIAVNVLHDARHVPRSLRRLRSLTRAGGTLLVIEATERDSAFQLATIGFIEGLNGYEDVRAEDDKPMLDAGQWQRMLEESGYEVNLVWPEERHGNWRQSLFMATPMWGTRPCLVSLPDHLRAAWRGPDVTLDVRLCDDLPDGQGRRAPAHEPRVPHAEFSGERRPEVETAVADIWSSLLSRGVEATSDFFASGGDSLIATRMIATLNAQGFAGASLRHIFEYPRLVDFCAAIAAAVTRPQDRMQSLASGRDATDVFAFHGSDGGIEPYLQLARALDCTVHGIAADAAISAPSLTTLVRRYVAAIRQKVPHGPYHLLGWSYGAFLVAEAAAQLKKAGEAVQMVLLDPVCRADFSYADRTGLLRLLCDGRAKVGLPMDFDDLTEPLQLQTFLDCATAAAAWSGPSDPATAAAEIARIDHLLGLSKTASRAVIDVPCLWLTAKHRPAHWHPAEEEWAARLPFATRDTVDADHWRMVLDRTTCEDIADRWRLWRARMPMERSA